MFLWLHPWEIRTREGETWDWTDSESYPPESGHHSIEGVKGRGAKECPLHGGSPHAKTFCGFFLLSFFPSCRHPSLLPLSLSPRHTDHESWRYPERYTPAYTNVHLLHWTVITTTTHWGLPGCCPCGLCFPKPQPLESSGSSPHTYGSQLTWQETDINHVCG